MRYKTLLIYASILLIIGFVFFSQVNGLSSSDIEFKGMVKLNVEEAYCGAYDGTYYWLFSYNPSSDNISLLKISLNDGKILSNISTIISSRFEGYYNYLVDAIRFENYILAISSFYNETSRSEEFLLYKINLENFKSTYSKIFVPQDIEILSINVYKDKVMAIVLNYTTYNIGIMELDIINGKLVKSNILFEFASEDMHSYLAYFGDSLVAYTYGRIYDSNNNTIINITRDMAYNISYYFVYDLDNTEDGKKLSILLYAEYFEDSKTNHGLFLMIYQLKEQKGIGVNLGEANPTEPIGASSIILSTTSAVVATISISTIISAGSIAATATSSGITASASTSGTSLFSSKEGKGFWKYGSKIGKMLTKLLKRKKKRSEEKDKFEKPSYVKIMLYLAIISSLVSLLISLTKSNIFNELAAVIAIASIGVALGFGAFGSIIGLLLYIGIQKRILPPTSKFGVISLFVSIVGGLYGLFTAIIKFLVIIGVVSIIGILVIVATGISFAFAAYSFTLSIYSE